MLCKQVFVEKLSKNVSNVVGTWYLDNLEGEGGYLLNDKVSNLV